MGPPPSRPILKPINPHSTAHNWNKRELSVPHKKDDISFPRGTSQRPVSRKLGDEPQSSIYQMSEQQNDPYAFRATASGSQGFWNQHRQGLRSGGGNYRNNITRSLHNSEERRGSHHQFSQNQKIQANNAYDPGNITLYAGSSTGFQRGAGPTAAKFRAKKRSYGEALPPSDVIPQIGEYSANVPGDLSPADNYYGGSFQRSNFNLNHSLCNPRPLSKPSGSSFYAQQGKKKNYELLSGKSKKDSDSFMLKRQPQPSLADIGQTESIQFQRNERVDVRGLLTSQHEPGVNLFFYDWNNSKRNEGSRERAGVSRSGKRNTSANFFKTEDRTPKNKIRGGADVFEQFDNEKEAEKEAKEARAAQTENSPVSSRQAIMSVSPRGKVEMRGLEKQKRPDSQRVSKKRRGQPQINENVLMEEIVQEEILSPLHH